MFTTRLISGIILVLLSIVIVGQGGILLYAVTALISIIGLFELYRALGMQRRSLAVVGYVTACSYYGLLWFEGQRYVTLMIIAPVLSPKKSIEGAVGGVAGAALLGFIYASLFGASMAELDNPQAACTIACAIAAVISQIGDLAASAIKRNHNIKDYGHLIPGHGGILDRFDSMIFTAPAIYFALTFLK